MGVTIAQPSDGAKSLAIATLIIDLVLIQPTILILFKHGKRGILGWFYLQALCAIRIIANAITLHDIANHQSGGTATTILNSVGLSPIILAATGILHEARRIRNPELNDRLQWAVVFQYHMFVSGALILVVYGVVKLISGDVTTTSSALLKVGAAALVVCYVFLLGWSLLSLRMRRQTNSSAYEMGSKLLYGVLVSMPFIAIRLGYGVASLMLELNHPTSSFLTSMPAKVILGLVPEVIVQTALIVAGLLTLSANKLFSRTKDMA